MLAAHAASLVELVDCEQSAVTFGPTNGAENSFDGINGAHLYVLGQGRNCRHAYGRCHQCAFY
jgi:hypothetical protein